MKRLLLILLLANCIGNSYATTRHALVIGIGTYPQQSGWSKINGDRDVQIIIPFLLERKFHRQNIQTLVNEQATRQAIESALEKLISKLNFGDMVYIHFSGHGQQITDINTDETDRYDEAWIPYDAMRSYDSQLYKGQNHLTDDVLKTYFSSIKAKIGTQAQLVVVIDACHSGDGTRGDDPNDTTYIVRGVYDKFELPQNLISKQSHKIVEREEIQWIVMSACEDFQQNYESNQGYGSLSFALYKIRKEISSKTIVEVFKMTKHQMADISPNPYQTPCMEAPSKELNSFLFHQ